MKPRFAQRAAAALLAALALTSHTLALSDDKPAGKVDGPFIWANVRTTTEWPSYGLDYAETRFSRLARAPTSPGPRCCASWTASTRLIGADIQ